MAIPLLSLLLLSLASSGIGVEAGGVLAVVVAALAVVVGVDAELVVVVVREEEEDDDDEEVVGVDGTVKPLSPLAVV